MSVYVGLDCGGSSSRVLAVDARGEVLFQGHSGAANLVSTPDARLRRNLAQAAQGCPSPSYVCGCFAGLVSDEVRARGLDRLRDLFPAASVRAEPDYTAALYASPQGTDVCVVAGTGSLVCSRAGRGVVKSGGKGYLLGDEGSAFAYGRDALRYFLNHPRDASSALRKAVAEVFGTEDEGEIVSSVYRAPTPAPLLARLAKAVGADATAGEEYALRLADWHGGQLAEITLAHIARHLPGADAVSVCLAGGLWKASAAFRDTFAGRLAEGLGRRELVVSRIARPPLHGAVELAREMEFGNRK